MQAEAGANALQIFDSWVGAVNADQYKQGIYPHMERIIKTVKAVSYTHLDVYKRQIQLLGMRGAVI